MLTLQDEVELQAEIEKVEKESLAKTLLERQRVWKLKEQGDLCAEEEHEVSKSLPHTTTSISDAVRFCCVCGR